MGNIPSAGFSLIQLMICCALAGILLSTSLPNLREWIDRQQTFQQAQSYQRAISLARSTAVTSGLRVTFCRSRDGLGCNGQWDEGSLVFTDANGDRKINGDDQILYRRQASELGGTIRFRSFGNRQYLQLTPLGTTRYQNGSFTFCPKNLDTRQAQQLIVSRTGRTRYARDDDGDGIKETSSGEPLGCP